MQWTASCPGHRRILLNLLLSAITCICLHLLLLHLLHLLKCLGVSVEYLNFNLVNEGLLIHIIFKRNCSLMLVVDIVILGEIRVVPTHRVTRALIRLSRLVEIGDLLRCFVVSVLR